MKIRNGFVSNRSSSSFVLFGIKLSPSQAQKVFKASGGKTNPSCDCGESDCEVCGLDGLNAIAEFFDERFYDFKKLEVGRGLENLSNEDFFIGISPEHMKNDETLLQFKTRIAALLTERGLKAEAKQIKFYADAGYPD